ncbi:pyruvate dehydrogenase (acetyl-transferring) E1 component subunit alpha [Candidatus Micrarchaeota archaeon]|nr:pyruvate dehydrogenase (acetyl-transferring) E1 component subunit alpha [Candidatus Micrarchaeota archaeon]
MVFRSLARFSVNYLQVLDEHGQIDARHAPKLTPALVKHAFDAMVLGRAFDETALALQREGRLLTYGPGKGEEAAHAGSALALRKGDWIVPSFRENTAYLARGYPPELLFEYWMGDERGQKMPKEHKMLPVAVPVSTQIPHAVGIAYAAKLLKKNEVVLTYFGDGATSKGDFYEALNFAGVFRLPVIFACINNQYAISLPRERQSAARTLAQKAIAAGIDSIQVDGNDVFACYRATQQAVERARKGEPTLIEFYTYRMGDHTTSDEASRYRSAKEVARWAKRDPISRLSKYALGKKLWNKQHEQKIWKLARKRISDAVAKAEAIGTQPIEDIFAYTYSQPTPRLREQLEEARKEAV